MSILNSLSLIFFFFFFNSLSMEEVNQCLDELALSNVTKDRGGVKKSLQYLLRNTSAQEQKWLIRIIMKVCHTFSSCIHQEMYCLNVTLKFIKNLNVIGMSSNFLHNLKTCICIRKKI